MEKVNFKIELEGHGWEDKWPDAIISVANKVYINTLVQRGTNFYEFDAELSDGGEHALSIAYTNNSIGPFIFPTVTLKFYFKINFFHINFT